MTTGEYLNFVAGLAVATVAALAITGPQLADALADRERLQRERDVIERRCDFYPNGSAKCPPRTFKFHPSNTTTSTTAATPSSTRRADGVTGAAVRSHRPAEARRST